MYKDLVIQDRFLNEWASSPVTLRNLDGKAHDNLEQNLYEGEEEFALFEVDNDIRVRIGVSSSPKRQYGSVMLYAHTKIGSGTGRAASMGEAFANIFEGRTLDGVRYKEFVESPSFTDRGWFVRPFQIFFEYD